MYPIAHFLNAALDATPTYGHPAATRERLPRTNILEGEQDYRIVMDLPGVRNEDLDISLEGEFLTVKADRDLTAPDGYTGRRCELDGKISWQRSFDVGNGIDAAKISASLDQGVLTLPLPTSDKAMPRRIQVQ